MEEYLIQRFIYSSTEAALIFDICKLQLRIWFSFRNWRLRSCIPHHSQVILFCLMALMSTSSPTSERVEPRTKEMTGGWHFGNWTMKCWIANMTCPVDKKLTDWKAVKLMLVLPNPQSQLCPTYNLVAKVNIRLEFQLWLRLLTFLYSCW